MQKPLEKNSYSCEDLVQIVEMLRSPEGCPWDRAQDHHTIRNNFLEETYEAVEAIDRRRSWGMFCCRSCCMPKWKRKPAALILTMYAAASVAK